MRRTVDIVLTLIVVLVTAAVAVAPSRPTSGIDAAAAQAGTPQAVVFVEAREGLVPLRLELPSERPATVEVCINDRCQTHYGVLRSLQTDIQFGPKNTWPNTRLSVTYRFAEDTYPRVAYASSLPADGIVDTTPTAAPTSSTVPYEFTYRQHWWGGDPIGWDTCGGPYPVWVNPNGYTKKDYIAERAILATTLTYIQTQTGLQFVPTDNPSEAAVTIERVADIPRDSNSADGETLVSLATAGARYTWSMDNTRWQLTSGHMQISDAAMERPARARSVLYLHEFGHILGLAHSSQRSQLMYPITQRLTPTFGKQEKAALAVLYPSVACPS